MLSLKFTALLHVPMNNAHIFFSIVVRTANPGSHLGRSPTEWSVNGVGRKVSHSFGYGLMDAAAMVRLARNWETVPEQQRCEIYSPHLDK